MIYKFKIALTLFLCTTLSACTDYLDAYSADKVFSDPQVIALAEATKAGDTQTIDLLLANGVNIDSTGVDNLTTLYWALTYVTPNESVKTGFKHLLQKGANPMHVHEPSELPLLHMTARADDPDYLDLVLEYGQGIDLNYLKKDGFFQTPMANAISARNFENFKTLFNAGANIETKDSMDDTVLIVASMPGTWKYALFLLENGANHLAGNEKTAANPEERPAIVRALEDLYYGDFKYPNKEKTPTDRDKIVEFLVEKGVEVYPFYKIEDERYNPRPPLPEGVTEAQLTLNGCNSTYSGIEDLFIMTEYNDVNLYQDISPDNYSLEGSRIFGLGMINFKKHSYDEIGVIQAEFYGQDTDLFTNYIYRGQQKDRLSCVTQTENRFLPSKFETNNEITETEESIYVINPDSCFKKDGIFRFEEVPFSDCEDFITDAQTYRTFMQNN